MIDSLRWRQAEGLRGLIASVSTLSTRTPVKAWKLLHLLATRFRAAACTERHIIRHGSVHDHFTDKPTLRDAATVPSQYESFLLQSLGA